MHRDQEIAGPTKRSYFKASRFTLISVLVAVVLLVASRFITTSHYRSAILNADQAEVYYYAWNNKNREVKLTTIHDRNELARLAKSIKASGLWLPVDSLVANTYELVAIRNGEDQRHIIIRGEDSIREGAWTTSISPDGAKTIREIVRSHGKTIPDIRELLPALVPPENPIRDKK